jgi:hypothetical protein
MPAGSRVWIPLEDDKLRELAVKGCSSREITQFLPGRSRNSIIGRAGRLGIRLDGIGGYASAWTAAKKAKLAQMYFSGLGYSRDEMARELGVTDNMVRKQLSKLRAKQGLVRPRVSVRTGLPATHPAGPRLAPASTARAVDAVPRRIKFMELGAKDCRYILDERVRGIETLFCGAEVMPDQSWCGPHCRAVFVAR